MKKIRQFISVILLFTQAFGSLLVLADFELNRDYIAEFLCINRDNAELQCGGKCQLQKGLEKEHENKSEVSVASFQLAAPVTYDFCSYPPENYPPASAKIHSPLSIGTPVRAVGSIFHPPAFV